MSDAPHVTVAIATRNRAPILRAVLERLGATRAVSFAWRVVVADSGSTDETGTVLADFADRLPLRTIRVDEPGKNRALNAALHLFAGRLTVFTDDDVLVSPGWLEALVDAARRWPDKQVFGGRVLLADPPGTPRWRIEIDPDYFDSFGRFDLGEEEQLMDRSPYGGCYAVRSSLFETMSFDDSVGPDGSIDYAQGSEAEFLARVMRDQSGAVYVPGARVYHIVRPEQLSDDRIVARGRTIGRGLALHRPAPGAATLAGAPRWLWRSVAREAVASVRHWRSAPDRLRHRVRLACHRGMLDQYRLASRR